MEVDDGEGLGPAGKGWMRHYAPPEFHLFAAGVEALKELFIVVQEEVLVLVERVIPFISLGTRRFPISSLQAILEHGSFVKLGRSSEVS